MSENIEVILWMFTRLWKIQVCKIVQIQCARIEEISVLPVRKYFVLVNCCLADVFYGV